MIIYRVEDNYGQGPYGDNDIPLRTLDKVRCTSRCPGASREGEPFWLLEKCAMAGTKVEHSSAYRFGFSSISQLSTWFTPEVLEEIFELGFRISRYNVDPDKVYQSKTQLCFYSSTAVWLGYVL